MDQIAVNQEQSLEVIKVTSTERESGRILDQIVDVPVPQQERVWETSLEQQIVEGPVPGIAWEFVEFVDVPVLVVWEEF